MTDRSKVYKLCPRSSEWPDGAEWWAASESGYTLFWNTEPFPTMGHWHMPKHDVSHGFYITLPAHISWRDTLVSKAELQAWEAEQALAPCPFCGSPAHLFEYEHDYGTDYTVSCDDEECYCEVGSMGKHEAIKRWNRRKQPPADPQPAPSLEQAMAEATQWANVQFPNSTNQAKVNHLLEEAKELADDPTNGEEMADICMLIGHLAAANGVNLAEEITRKLAINKAREWGEPNEQGYVKHVEGDPQPAEPQSWGDDYIRRRINEKVINPTVGGVIVAMIHRGTAFELMQRVRDDTAAERDAHWQARVNATAKRHVDAKKRVIELEQSDARAGKIISDLESKVTKGNRLIAELEQQLADSEARLNGTGYLLDETEKAATEAEGDAKQLAADLETAEGIIKRLEKERDDLRTHLTNANSFADLFEDEYTDAEQAAQLWQLWQAFVAWNESLPPIERRDWIEIYTDGGVQIQEPHRDYDAAIAWLETETESHLEAEAQPDDGAVSVGELIAFVNHIAACGALQDMYTSETAQALRQRHEQHGIKPTEG